MEMTTAPIIEKEYQDVDHRTWGRLFASQVPLRDQQLVPEFSRGLDLLGITGERVPSLREVNVKLEKLTGWRGVPVHGFEGPETFYRMLARKEFPVGQFIRDAKDLSYTPEPDVFHDLYGHLPFYTDPEYASFSQKFGELALGHIDSPERVEEFQRLFWFTLEFGLLKTSDGLRIFGAGIASSHKECAYALSGQPTLVPFSLAAVFAMPFRIDIMQETLFVLESREQLYSCLKSLR